MFGESGFKEVDSKKLEFDLTEGETMDWVRLSSSFSPSSY
jgi:hypothetical protein